MGDAVDVLMQRSDTFLLQIPYIFILPSVKVMIITRAFRGTGVGIDQGPACGQKRCGCGMRDADAGTMRMRDADNRTPDDLTSTVFPRERVHQFLLSLTLLNLVGLLRQKSFHKRFEIIQR